MIFTAAKKAVAALADSWGAAAGSELLVPQQQALATAVAQAQSATSMVQLREAFEPLSVQFIQLAEQHRFTNQPLYLQYCPMANNNQGAQWLSTSPVIANPYYGEAMHRCGETVRRL